MEGRSKRENLRITGLREGIDNGQTAREFVAGLLKGVLELEEKPVIALRALRKCPGDNEPPRHLILNVHHGHVFDDIFCKIISKRELCFQRKQIEIFRDLPQEAARARAAFTPTRRLLQDKPGVRFWIAYPAKLGVTQNGTEVLFVDPKRAFVDAECNFEQR